MLRFSAGTTLALTLALVVSPALAATSTSVHKSTVSRVGHRIRHRIAHPIGQRSIARNNAINGSAANPRPRCTGGVGVRYSFNQIEALSIFPSASSRRSCGFGEVFGVDALQELFINRLIFYIFHI